MNIIGKSWLLVMMCCLCHVVKGSEMYRSLLENDCLRHATIGVCVVDVDTRQVVVSFNAEKALVPASVMKVLTAASVMTCYDDTARIYTQVGYSGTITDGVLYGDVIVKGRIDPSLGHKRAEHPESLFVKQATSSIEQAGIKTIHGHIIVDASSCRHGGYTDWMVEDVGYYYGAACHGINYKGNAYNLYLRTGAKGTQPEILGTSTDFFVSHYDNMLRVGEKDSSFVMSHPYATEALLIGQVPAHRDTFSLVCAMPDPPLALALDMQASLQAQGIVMEGELLTDRLCRELDYNIQPMTEVLYNHASDPMHDMLRTMMFYSDNLYAESLLRYMALSENTAVDLTHAIDMQRRLWQSEGLDVSQVNARDGSGLSRKNALTPRFVASLLTHAFHDERLGQRYLSIFPQAGRDATVRSFMSRRPLPGRLLLKSGSMSGVLCYAGYYIHEGKTYAIALMGNNFSCTNAQVRSSYELFLHRLFTTLH